MIYYIGIDPSMNSTGICIQKYNEDDIKVNENYIILTPSRKLTKREQIANESLAAFEYQFYDKRDLKEFKEDNHAHEYWKTWNMLSITNAIKNIIYEFTKEKPAYLYIVIEGISYGSATRTKSIFDLAGLNYLARENFIEKNNISFTIATPSEIKKFASGNGNCNKDIMINLFRKANPDFDIVPKVDDIADAWFMANFAYKLQKKDET